MGLLLALIINLVLSYARNLRLLFDNQTEVLSQVSNGDMGGFVPVATQDEFGFIAGHTNMMIDGLRDRMRLLEGIAVASEVQETLLPDGPPEADFLRGRLEVAGRCLYSDETGGDYYDYLTGWGTGESGAPALGVVVGDVTGHGVGAALLMASVRAFVRMRAVGTTDPAVLLSDVNKMTVADSYGTGRFVTMFLLHIDPESLQVSWATAGHEPALVYSRTEGTFTRLYASGLPLGTMEDAVYEAACCRQLHRDDIVLLYTDGLVEARNAAGEMFGRDRLRSVVRDYAASGAQSVVDALCDVVGSFQGGVAQEDDVTVVAIRVV
ncbi:SpoIIE family protein phosphatase [Oleidesulfovibrio sp.]|uniref:PP2C family protein-serine/threonine phosphatase n=1 Tax=Oleidesulfovibrio sp. TaxID=2909707 RepID=UPI003A8BD721